MPLYQDTAANTNAAAAKTTPVDADVAPIIDSAASNGLKKVTWANIKATLKAYFDTLYSPRISLTGNRTYYVRKDGSDANTGLVDNAAGAKLTINACLAAVQRIDFNGFQVTIQIRDGTYSEHVFVPRMTGQAQASDLVLLGNTTTPTNVVVSNTGAYSPAIEAIAGAICSVQALRVTAPNNGYGLNAAEAGVINVYAGVDFGDCSGQYHMYANNGGVINCFAPYTISGPASAHWGAAYSGAIFASATINANSAALAFSFGFAAAIAVGSMQVNGCTFQNVGSITGARYAVQTNGVVQTFGSGATYLPGNSAGTSASGGQYA